MARNGGVRLGKRNEQIELALGGIIHRQESSSTLLPDLHAAWVYQPKNFGFTFRAGLGFPDGAFLGIGGRF